MSELFSKFCHDDFMVFSHDGSIINIFLCPSEFFIEFFIEFCYLFLACFCFFYGVVVKHDEYFFCGEVSEFCAI